MTLLRLVILLLIASICPAYGGSLTLPQELAEAAKQADCTPIDNFFDRPAMIAPPYLYGYRPGKGMAAPVTREQSAVFWCQQQRQGATLYQLVFLHKDHSGHGFSVTRSARQLPCATPLKWGKSRGAPPGGLTVATTTGEPLNRFVYATQTDRKGPDQQVTSHPPLQSRYDGVGWDFYCHQGDWLVRQRH